MECVRKHVLASFATYTVWRPGFKSESFLKMSNKEDPEDFEAVVEKQTFCAVNVSLSQVNKKLY